MNDAFALAGRASSLHHTQGVALGYELLPLQGEAIIVLCFYILHFQFWDAAYYRVFTLCKKVKKNAGRSLAGRVDFNYALCLRTDNFYNSPCRLLQRFPLGVKAKMMKIMQGTATTANTM